jgi:hypothetical protein
MLSLYPTNEVIGCMRALSNLGLVSQKFYSLLGLTNIEALRILMNVQWLKLFCLSVLLTVLNACGGGGGGSDNNNSASAASNAETALTSVSGIVTYTDYPVAANGIDYSAEQSKPVRGAVIQLLDSSGNELAAGNTGSDGSYSLSANVEGSARVLVRAELGLAGNVNTRVVDNTSNDALYTLFTDINLSGNSITQNLNAGSGWNGSRYATTRSAGPFSILDVIYQAQQLITSVDNSAIFPLLTVNWSTQNSSAEGRLADGDIGTSFYLNDNLYILGRANFDTDEYDKGVIAHEWGHYFEDNFSRSDSPGGSHSQGDILHPSVAWSEGFGTAFAAIILEDPLYIDTFGPGQSISDITNVEQDSDADTAIFNGGSNPLLDGYYSETSVMELLYDLVDAGAADDDSLALGFAPIYQVLTGDFSTTKSFTSLFPFLYFLKLVAPTDSEAIKTLFSNENIDVDNANEFDNPSDANLPPIYTEVAAETTVTLDSNGQVLQTSNAYGNASSFNNTGNKLLNQRFFKATANVAGCFTIAVTPQAPTTSADLSLVFVDNAKIDVFSGGSTESRNINLTAGEIVTFAVGAFSNNVSFKVSFLSGC